MKLAEQKNGLQNETAGFVTGSIPISGVLQCKPGIVIPDAGRSIKNAAAF